MPKQPFTSTDTRTGLTVETVNTAALRQGDFILNNGCLMQLGPFQSRPNDQGHPERGLTRWARGYIIPQDGTGAIPREWFSRDESGFAYWMVQGNDLATWNRYQNPDKLPVFDSAPEAAQ